LIWLNSSCGEYHSPVLTVLQKMVQAWNFIFFVLAQTKPLIFQKKNVWLFTDKVPGEGQVEGWNMLYK
jgi:hypothetical protein